MALRQPESESTNHRLSVEEGKRFFDEQVREVLGISGEEFLRRYDAGEYADVPDTPEGWPIFRLTMLTAFGRG
jgi:hypothetical protein